jgi:uncharacterized protein
MFYLLDQYTGNDLFLLQLFLYYCYAGDAMNIKGAAKERLKREIIEQLIEFPEIQKVVIFGSFLFSDEPNDLDIAVFQDSDENYYPLAMKYRKKLRSIANRIPIDVVPIRKNPENATFLKEIENGEILYER